MTLRKPSCVALLLCAAAWPARAADPYSIKPSTEAAPKELAEPVRKLMGDRAVQLLNAKGEVLAEVWFRKDVPAKAQSGSELTYQQVPESTVVGALKVVKQIRDYRKQKIKPGVYTLRYGTQPMDGDHMGTAPYSEFLLACPAADDKAPTPLETKALNELSGKTTGSHPAVLLLFPGAGAEAEPKLVNKGEGHWVLFQQLDATAGGKKAKLPVGLTLIGASSSV
jgi:hypothetical protein